MEAKDDRQMVQFLELHFIGLHARTRDSRYSFLRFSAYGRNLVPRQGISVAAQASSCTVPSTVEVAVHVEVVFSFKSGEACDTSLVTNLGVASGGDPNERLLLGAVVSKT